MNKNVPGFSPESIDVFEAYPWPGNVRELENELERIVVLAEAGQKIPLDLLSPHIRESVARGERVAPASAFVVPYGLSYDAARSRLDEALVQYALQESAGVVSRAAHLLGMERSRLSKIRRRLLARSGGGPSGTNTPE
jgi:two-component system response regulator HupR/HoxA